MLERSAKRDQQGNLYARDQILVRHRHTHIGFVLYLPVIDKK
jgi:hypothetical protein